MSDKINVKIMGEGNITEGEYGSINIMGEAKAQGHITCEKAKVLGSFSHSGNLNVYDNFTILGEVEIRGRLNSNSMKVLGELDIEGEIEIEENLKVLGEFESKGNVKCKYGSILGELKNDSIIEFEEMKITGELDCVNCEGTSFLNLGRVNISNFLSGDKIEIDPLGESYINEIGGSEIIIKRREGKNSINFFNMSIKLNYASKSKTNKKRTKVNLIEGDNIVLQNTICDIVRGENITILDNCEIKRIEYKENIDIDESSYVGESICLKS